ELPTAAACTLARPRQARVAREVGLPRPRLGARQPRAARSPLTLVQLERLDDLLAHRVDRAERRHRLLRDQRDLGAADRPQLGALRREPGQNDRGYGIPLDVDPDADDTPWQVVDQ